MRTLRHTRKEEGPAGAAPRGPLRHAGQVLYDHGQGGTHMRPAAILLATLLLLGCDDDGGPADTDPPADGDADSDIDADWEMDGDFPPLDCGDNADNYNTCMLNWPDGGPEWGVLCGGICRPSCGPLLGLECPGTLVCHRAGPNGVCFEE